MSKVTQLTTDAEGGLERRRLHLREISDEEDAPLETVGQDLRTARTRKGEDLATVSRALKIRKDHIEALECSNLDALPGRAYAIGFLRSYSEYLGLDSARCVERFKAEIAGRGDGTDMPPQITIQEERKLPQGTVVLVILLLTAVAYGGYYLTVSADRMLSQSSAVPDRLSGETTPQSQASDPASAPAAPVTQVPAQDATATTAPLPDATTQDTAAIPAVPATPENTPTPEQVAALPPGRAFGTKNADSRVLLRVHANTRILVQGKDNTVFINRAMRPGDLYQAPNLVGLELTTPDSGAVEILLDGGSLGFLGPKSTIAEGLSLNPQDLVDRYNQSHSG